MNGSMSNLHDSPLPEDLVNKINCDEFYFIQIGSNDGISHDPIYRWINKFNWAGLMFEPQKEPYQKLYDLYKNNKLITTVQLGISKTPGRHKLYRHLGQGNSIDNFTGGSSLSLRNSNEFSSDRYEEIKCITFMQALKKFNVSKIDLLVIDTEGHDLEIIDSIDFSISMPRNIWFEYWPHDNDDLNNPELPTGFNQNNNVIDKVKSFGYNLHNYGENMLLTLGDV